MIYRAGFILLAAAMAALLLGSARVYAIAPEQMPTPQLEARYLALIHGFRCMQCQDESLADSPVNLAADMRRQIRDMLLAGRTDQQVRDFMVSRYGYFILFKPPFVAKTAWLWLTPGVLLLIGVIAALTIIRRRAALVATDLEDNDLTDA
ncbi:MAG TPA: cytochrome c-type biogenesis protein [Steroidobacteraceae bacterium]|jgi:cytochrome c-type biogenesis protein CcmH|nr:cytochrome c-type biogenesis protein [Steroidobacteraceae bacterium]